MGPNGGIYPATCGLGQICQNTYAPGVNGPFAYFGYFNSVNPQVTKKIINPIVNYNSYFYGFYPPPVSYASTGTITITQSMYNPQLITVNMVLGGSINVGSQSAVITPTNNSTGAFMQFEYSPTLNFQVQTDQAIIPIGAATNANATVTLIGTGVVGTAPIVRTQ